jgi:hypothetical protein
MSSASPFEATFDHVLTLLGLAPGGQSPEPHGANRRDGLSDRPTGQAHIAANDAGAGNIDMAVAMANLLATVAALMIEGAWEPLHATHAGRVRVMQGALPPVSALIAVHRAEPRLLTLCTTPPEPAGVDTIVSG